MLNQIISRLKLNKEIVSTIAPVQINQADLPKISVIGLGYVGAVTSVCFADMGFHVIGVDTDEKKVLSMNNGIPPIVEDGLAKNLSLVINRDRFKATINSFDAIMNTDVTMVSVCTPSHEDGHCNIDHLKTVSETIGLALAKKETYHLILFRSTTPPGTTRKILIPIIEKVSGKKCGTDFGVAFNPEFLRETTAIKDFHSPAKTVIGASDEFAARMTKRLYRTISGEKLVCTMEAAEFVKYIDNTWHALKVSFGNEVGRLCKAANVDSYEVMDIFCKDHKLNISEKYLMPGSAFGGSCLPKDVRGIQYLAKELNQDLPIMNSIIHSNNSHICHIVDLIKKQKGAKVGFLGVTFKSGTDDMRESPILPIIEQLKYMDFKISLHDENLNDASISQGYGSNVISELSKMKMDDAYTLCQNSDVIVVTHYTPEYEKLLETFSLKKPVIDLVRLNKTCRDTVLYQGVCW
ncbi:MAG: nucleotide sugar dehydrogenase [Emcibacteraceae bacterium]|nr:nucleotide sugar dehydrogenase [Emcibacteraceae bacterium]